MVCLLLVIEQKMIIYIIFPLFVQAVIIRIDAELNFSCNTDDYEVANA